MFKLKNSIVSRFIFSRKSISLRVVIIGFITNVFTIMIPVSIGKYYELVFHYQSRRSKILSFLPESIWNTVPRFLVVFLLLVSIRYLCFFLYRFSLKSEGELFIKEVKDELFNHQLRVKSDIYNEKGIGKYLLRYTGDINSLKTLYLKGTITVLIDIGMIIIAFAGLYILNANGAIAIILISAMAYLVIRFFNTRIEKHSLQKRNMTSGQLSYVSRTLNGILSIILFNKQDVEYKKYRKKSSAVMSAAIDYNKWLLLNRGFISFLQYAMLGSILYIFYIENNPVGNENNGANLISFILLYLTILPVIRRLFNLNTIYKLGYISLNKLNGILCLESENIDLGEVLQVNKPRLEFESLEFEYSDLINFVTKKVTVNTITLPKGLDTICLIKAITRLNDNYKGSIKINAIDIKQYTPASLRNNISIISKDIPLVGRTVYEVITKYRSAKIKSKSTEIFNDIQHSLLPSSRLKIDDKIGENGSNLSGLQYELLCFVRGILSECKVLIMTELPHIEPIAGNEMETMLREKNVLVLKLILPSTTLQTAPK